MVRRRYAVRVDSGPIQAWYPLHEVPKDQWENLVSVRRTFLETRLTYDCRCLVEFIRDAETLWAPLGYRDPDHLVAEGYGLEPEEIRLAVRWLELNEPESAIGLETVLGKAQQLAADPEVRPAESEEDRDARLREQASAAGKAGGRGRGKEDSQCANSTKADNHGSTHASTIVRRLKRDHPAVAEALARGEYKSARAAGIAAGIVKVPTTLDILQRAWGKATVEDKATLAGELTYEERVALVAVLVAGLADEELGRLGLRRVSDHKAQD